MSLDVKKITDRVKKRLAADSDKEYYTFENDTIKQTTGRDYSLKEWINLYLDDFTEDIIEIPLKENEKERHFDEIKESISKLLTNHIKKFFKDHNNKVGEDTWEDEVADLKKQIKKHYWKVPSYIENLAENYIRGLTDKLKLT